jgi:hypothetical protein
MPIEKVNTAVTNVECMTPNIEWNIDGLKRQLMLVNALMISRVSLWSSPVFQQ